MIKTLPQSSDETLGFGLDGQITRSDCDGLITTVEHAIDDNGAVNLLLDMSQYQGIGSPALALAYNINEGIKGKITRLAVVGSERDFSEIERLSGAFNAQNLQKFPPDQTNKAWHWVQAN